MIITNRFRKTIIIIRSIRFTYDSNGVFTRDLHIFIPMANSHEIRNPVIIEIAVHKLSGILRNQFPIMIGSGENDPSGPPK